jgi:hypothetical protein
MTRNSELLESFTKFCQDNPDMRFWQALRNWCGWSFVFLSNADTDAFVPRVDSFKLVDTYYWEENRKHE